MQKVTVIQMIESSLQQTHRIIFARMPRRISIVLHALLVFHAWLVITNLQDGQQRTAHIGHSL